MTIWFTSDHHFGHGNIVKYCGRPWATTKGPDIFGMNTAMISRWNGRVQPGDTVYHLGDFAWGQGTMLEVVKELNGEIHLIRGNHDKRMGKHVERHFHWVGDYKEINVEDEEMDTRQKIVLFHYPIESWNARHHGSWHLHGHVHGTKHVRKVNKVPGRLDVGVDAHDFYPISYDEVKTIFTLDLVQNGV